MLRNVFLTTRFFQALGVVIFAFALAFFAPHWILFPKLLFSLFLAAVFADALMLFLSKKGITGDRQVPEKLSNGDDNDIRISLRNPFAFRVTLDVYDELPHQFQKRDAHFTITLASEQRRTISYQLRPVKRGVYAFGLVNVYAKTPLGLLSRRFRLSNDTDIPVYPSYLQMRKYELMAISNRLMDSGIKKVRRIGHQMEFELIKEYVSGDDYRTINWKATARKSALMVNHYQDEKSQQVYCVIDKGRVMQMPFNGMSLLDYAINASLVISNIAIRKSDKAGIITFQDKVGTTLAAGRQSKQMQQILEVLYNQKTAYRESDFSALHNHVRRKLGQRSLLLLFTNFESVFGMQRQLPFIKSLSRLHLVVVIFFENSELSQFAGQPAENLREIYQKTIAEKFIYEKKLIVRELARHGIQALLTRPEELTVQTINKYLELKARGMI